MNRRTAAWLAAALVLVMGAAGCTSSGGAGQKAEVSVFAAGSLTAALQSAKPIYEAAHTDTSLVLNLGASNALRTQIEQGADADIFISASKKEVDPLAASGEAASVKAFVHNQLVIAVAPEGKDRVRTPADLTAGDLRLVLAARATPIGDYTDQALTRMDQAGQYGAGYREQVLARVRSYENTEQDVVSKVSLGEADAGIVYRSSITKAARAQGVTAVEIPPDMVPPVEFYLAVMKGAGAPAQAFADWLSSSEGANVLTEFGFVPVGSK
jgi:molybdate transport system substrate-binding protein